jgi:DNA-binding protein YbaB
MDPEALLRAFGPIKERLARAEQERQEARVEGSAGGGAIRVVLRGDLRVERVTVAPAAAAGIAGDPTMLEDLIAAAVEDALRQYRERFGVSAEEQMQRTLGGDGGLGSLFAGL